MSSQNFNFIEKTWPVLGKEASLAEEYVHRDPESALVKLRRFCEIIVDIIYSEYSLQPPFPNANLFDLLDNQPFLAKIPDEIIDKLNVLRQSGNKGAHIKYKVTPEHACSCLNEAWDISRWWYIVTEKGGISDCGHFINPLGRKTSVVHSPNDTQSISSLQQKIIKQKTYDSADLKTITSKISHSLNFDRKSTEKLIIDYSQAGYCSHLEEFVTTDNNYIVNKLREYIESPGDSQISAWRNSVSLLKPIVSDLISQFPHSAKQCSIIFEYTVPLESRRIDVLLLLNGTVVVLEFKGHSQVRQADIDQAAAYARDLRAYHRGCSNTLVISLLVLTRKDCQITKRKAFGVEIVHYPELYWHLNSILQKKLEPLPLHKMLDYECYRPLPTLIKAARELFNSGNIHRVHRAATATEPTLKTCTSIIEHTAQSKRRSLILICGVPGAGKTLVGLQLAHSDLYAKISEPESTEDSTAIFLSGNGPLVEVLKYELRSAGGGGKAFVRGVHEYVKTFTKNNAAKIPHQVLIYDEAQRAFDADQVREKHHNLPIQFNGLSEPELFIQFAERLPDWCVVVGLIGTGQEIHIGEEAGIGQWRDAIAKAKLHDEWDVYIPSRIDVQQAFKGLDRLYIKPKLELAATIRFHLATELHDFVEHVLDGRQPEAYKLSEALKQNNFNLVITHDLDKAKQYLHARYEGDRDARYGIVASAKDKELPQWGIEKGFRSRGEISPGGFGQWYAEPFGTENSCTNLNTVVTEFGAQGLELDACLLAWGTDFIRENSTWSNRFSSGYRDKHRIRDAKALRKNAYRVLLTRGRDGCVIYVPPIPNKMRETYQYLAGCGFAALE